ncbi:hypothetical protein pdam_00011203, partial [Pocillopora damicornis]
MASRKRKANSDGSTDNEYFTWTDEETALPLNELQELFIERYPNSDEFEVDPEEFPNCKDTSIFSKEKINAKLSKIKEKNSKLTKKTTTENGILALGHKELQLKKRMIDQLEKYQHNIAYVRGKLGMSYTFLPRIHAAAPSLYKNSDVKGVHTAVSKKITYCQFCENICSSSNSKTNYITQAERRKKIPVCINKLFQKWKDPKFEQIEYGLLPYRAENHVGNTCIRQAGMHIDDQFIM